MTDHASPHRATTLHTGGMPVLRGRPSPAATLAPKPAPGVHEGTAVAARWGIAGSPFGVCSIGWNSEGVWHLAFRDAGDIACPPDVPPGAELRRDDPGAARLTKKIFAQNSEVPVVVCGTDFQLAVWRALLAIPTGTTSSYSRVAAAVGRPRAARAVGAACSANPVGYLIPCHRVVQESGRAAGFRWGTDLKLAMLAWEKSR